MASLRRGVIVCVFFTVFGGPGIVLVYPLFPMSGTSGIQHSLHGGRRRRSW
jgi:hypothetical protein